jgi:glycerophosphoryl diester phosphodiesterase
LCYQNNKLVFDENTIPAFVNALDVGVEYLELDVQCSRDGKAVVFHDHTLDRVSTATGSVSEFDLSTLQRIQLHHGCTISSLDEVFEKLPQNCKLNIDVKNVSAIPDLAATISKHSAQGRVLVTSFSEKRRKSALGAIPGVATSPSGVLVLRIWWRIKVGLRVSKLLNLVNVLQIPVSYGPIRFDSPRFIESVKRHGVELVYWTINDPAEATRLRQIGANGIVTDRSDQMTKLFTVE